MVSTAPPPRLVRTFGAIVLAAGALTLLRAGLAGVLPASGVSGLVAVVLGGLVIAYADRLTLQDVAWISGLCTVLISAAIASRPTPYGAGATYVWVAPFAFMAGRRAGVALTAVAGATLAGAFAIQAARVADPLAFKTYASWWLVAIGTVVVVGAVTRGLVASLVATRDQLERGFRQGVLGMAFVDLDGRWQRVNPALAALLGYPEDELVDQLSAAFSHPDDVEISFQQAERLATEEHVTYEKRYLRADGEVRCFMLRTAPLRDGAGALTGYFTQYEDVTARRLTEALARESQRREAALAELGRQALALESLPELLTEAVRLTAATLGTSHASLHAADAGGEALAVAGEGPAPAAAPVAAVLDAPDGAVLDGGRCAAVAVTGIGEGPYAVLAVQAADHAPFDAADLAFLRSAANVLTAALRREAAERELRHHTLHDPLTRLPNRALLVDRLRVAVPRARRDGRSIAVLSVDLDDFMSVNERHGRAAGDELLRTLAARLHGALRANDTLARLGADEFVALCEGLEGPEEALAVADRLLAAVAAPQPIGAATVRCSASVGIALAGADDGGDAEGLLRDADLAMRRAKAAGGARYEVFEHAMRTRALQRVALTGDLDRALERGELELAFQPIVDLLDGSVHAAESLVRWNHPERGRVMPDEFIGLAERTGRIVELGRWVIRDAARQAAQWPQLTVGVNVSRRQLGDPDLIGDVAAALAAHGVAPGRFCVEVTETALMDDPARAEHALLALRDLGVKLSLDDFGTGYSSLSSVSDFPLDTLKLDRSFLPADPSAAGGWSIVRAVLDMARTLDLTVVAEGIETEVQRDKLQRLGCRLGQGYLFSRPVPGADLAAAVLSTSASWPVAVPRR